MVINKVQANRFEQTEWVKKKEKEQKKTKKKKKKKIVTFK
jgi:hypothetical protein